MILQVKKKTITRGEGTSTHHQALHVCALWHEVTKSLSLVIVTIIVIVMMSYLHNKVANHEVVGTTPTEASKKEGSIFDMPKNDASTSYNEIVQ